VSAPSWLDTPVTWGDLWWWWLPEVVGIVLFPIFLIGFFLQRPECKACGRSMQWRRKKPNHYASRWFCPFHDEGSPWP
jgi:hypothetical protein